MFKKLFYIVLVSVFGVSLQIGAMAQQLPSNIPSVRNFVRQFVNSNMNSLFPPSVRSTTRAYNVISGENGVVVRRVASSCEIPLRNANNIFSRACSGITDQLLSFYDAQGLAERIDIFRTNMPDTFFFKPIFLLNESSSEEDSADNASDGDEDMSEDANIIQENAPAA